MRTYLLATVLAAIAAGSGGLLTLSSTNNLPEVKGNVTDVAGNVTDNSESGNKKKTVDLNPPYIKEDLDISHNVSGFKLSSDFEFESGVGQIYFHQIRYRGLSNPTSEVIVDFVLYEESGYVNRTPTYETFVRNGTEIEVEAGKAILMEDNSGYRCIWTHSNAMITFRGESLQKQDISKFCKSGHKYLS